MKKEKIFGIKRNWIIVIVIVLVVAGVLAFNNYYGLVGGDNNTESNIQIVKMNVDYSGYSPQVLLIKPGIPVRWEINVEKLSGCNSVIVMNDYNIRKNLKIGLNIIEFTPLKEGEIYFSCSMNMLRGKFIVGGSNQTTIGELATDSNSLAGGTCGIASGSGGCGGSGGSGSCGGCGGCGARN
jgi:plastocyanin domain-containing protein